MTPFIYKAVYASGLSEIRTFEQLIVRLSDRKKSLKTERFIRFKDF